jgi:hypothetical protein
LSENLSAEMVDAAICTGLRERAYELYRRRGGSDGTPVPDWLQAEAEILSELNVLVNLPRRAKNRQNRNGCETAMGS